MAQQAALTHKKNDLDLAIAKVEALQFSDANGTTPWNPALTLAEQNQILGAGNVNAVRNQQANIRTNHQPIHTPPLPPINQNNYGVPTGESGSILTTNPDHDTEQEIAASNASDSAVSF